VAVATAARRFSQRRIDSCAVLRCLGLRPRDLVGLFALQFAWVGCIGCVAGVLAGSALHLVIVRALTGLLPTQLPAASIVPALQAFACGWALLAGFALAPVMRLRGCRRSGCCGVIWRHGLTSRRPSFTQSRPRHSPACCCGCRATFGWRP